jgi:alkylation response protein AidB-like acyl-CoA dehydrogenase
VAHRTSMRTIPWLRSSTSFTFVRSTAAQKDGQPVPESNFVSDGKSAVPQQTHLYMPTPLWAQYLPVKGGSVALQRVTWYCSRVSFARHFASCDGSGRLSMAMRMPPPPRRAFAKGATQALMRRQGLPGLAMPYTLTDDERAIQRVVREFARDRVGLAAAADRDRHDRFPAEAFQEAAGLGLTGLLLPDGGLGATAFAIAVDEVSQVDPALAAVLVAHNAALATAAGTPAGQSVAQAMAAGEPGALLIAEEATGSDALAAGTQAVPTPKGFRITGQKVWGVGAAAAKHLVVLARTPEGPAFFVVPRDAAGVSFGEGESLLGLRSAGIRTVYLSGVEVPAEARLGSDAEALLRTSRRWLQLGAAAALCGAVDGALQAAVGFAQERIQFNQPVGLFQAVSDGLSQIDIELAAARALTLAACGQAEQDLDLWAARAKAAAVQMAIPMTRQAIRAQGGTGFMRHGGSERFARDVRALQFLGEPLSVQRETVKRALLDLPFPPGA